MVLKTELFLKTQSLGGKNCAQNLERERVREFELKVVRENGSGFQLFKKGQEEEDRRVILEG